jgi:hypothetical protein
MFLVPQNFLPKLKQHLLARFLQLIQDRVTNPLDGDSANCGQILFRRDHLYRHNIMRINYTTYDVRRSQDVVHASTSHCNVMVLDAEGGGSSTHPFRYGKVLGIYHANVVYVGPEMADYQPRRMEFLWVRWYRRVETIKSGWDAHKLDRVQFLPMNDDNAFGFINPSEVLRSCHLIPAFAKGKVHADGKGLSLLARDSSDWVSYYVNR